MRDATCLFCKLASHEIPAKVVAEDAHTFAFLDVHPRAAGHAVVVSKYHCPTLADLPDDEVGPLFLAVKRVADKVLAGLNAEGLTIGINHGTVSGQTIPHLHIHVIPRNESDGGGSIHSVMPDPEAIDLAEVAKKLGIA